jgi:hypothetical protein
LLVCANSCGNQSARFYHAARTGTTVAPND